MWTIKIVLYVSIRHLSSSISLTMPCITLEVLVQLGKNAEITYFLNLTWLTHSNFYFTI